MKRGRIAWQGCHFRQNIVFHGCGQNPKNRIKSRISMQCKHITLPIEVIFYSNTIIVTYPHCPCLVLAGWIAHKPRFPCTTTKCSKNFKSMFRKQIHCDDGFFYHHSWDNNIIRHRDGGVVTGSHRMAFILRFPWFCRQGAFSWKSTFDDQTELFHGVSRRHNMINIITHGWSSTITAVICWSTHEIDIFDIFLLFFQNLKSSFQHESLWVADWLFAWYRDLQWMKHVDRDQGSMNCNNREIEKNMHLWTKMKNGKQEFEATVSDRIDMLSWYWMDTDSISLFPSKHLCCLRCISLDLSISCCFCHLSWKREYLNFTPPK